MPKMLEDTRNGNLFPMNPDLARHEAMRSVLVDKDGKVVRPDEDGADAPEIKEPSADKKATAAKADDKATASKRTNKASTKQTKADDDDLEI